MKFQRKFILDVLDKPHGTSRAYLSVALNEAELINLLSSTTSTFKDHGAQTLRFGHTVTGNDIGTYLLGVTYPSMAAIEATYTELATNQAFAKLSAGIDVDMRSIVRIAGIL
jgi:hypothetical protein